MILTKDNHIPTTSLTLTLAVIDLKRILYVILSVN